MRFMDIRRQFAAKGDANAYLRSDAATYRMAYNRPMPEMESSRAAKSEPGPVATYNNAERAMMKEMNGTQREVYLEIRDAAEVGDFAPSYRELGETINGSDWRVGRALSDLQKIGAIQRIPTRIRLAWRLPAAGIKTNTTGLRVREASAR